MQKYMMSVVLGLAVLAGTNGTLHAVQPTTSKATIAATEEAPSVYAREQYFGPFTQAVANQQYRAWTAKGYKCYLVRYPSGWYVKVIFQN